MRELPTIQEEDVIALELEVECGVYGVEIMHRKKRQMIICLQEHEGMLMKQTSSRLNDLDTLS